MRLWTIAWIGATVNGKLQSTESNLSSGLRILNKKY